jgi:hypothetical protein
MGRRIPERIAAAFALGVAISFFTPLTSFHTLIAPGIRLPPRPLESRRHHGHAFVVNPWTGCRITFEQRRQETAPLFPPRRAFPGPLG